jgi:cytochrome b561
MVTVPNATEQPRILRYSNVAVAFHWVTVALVVTQAVLGFAFAEAARGAAYATLFQWHKTLGVLILLIVLARLAYRLKEPPPPFPVELPKWERIVAVWNHRIFYFLLIVLPPIGFVAASGLAEGPTTPFVGGINVPVVPGIDKATGELFAEIHGTLAIILLVLIVLHIAAALKHQFYDHWRVSGRMPPFHAPDEEAVIGQGSAARSPEG